MIISTHNIITLEMNNKVCIHGTDVPIPIGCSEWTIVSDLDLDEITPALLETPVTVRVGRDYHGSSYHEHVSIFTAIIDVNMIIYIVNVCCCDYLMEYVDPRSNGNILHAAVLNPNREVLLYFVNLLGEDAVRYLANKRNPAGKVPLELIQYDREMFRLLMNFTAIDERMYKSLINNNPVAKSIFDE